ncbi:putative fyve phd zinc finger [Golovinomyces cichoracearum]|uniref:Putative fyve phd zinc finger n=1 Tax=Golovinomyces cichoracearum TaxID=62708 RepID=A0A420I1G2_9PEZI|nr:putative fyve phd zinc finger [Golovinomyces cichoracearum]
MDMLRRSSRAYRASQTQSTSTHTSASSSRADRATRSRFKSDSPEKFIPSNSLPQELQKDYVIQAQDTASIPTRRKRGRTEDQRDKLSRTQDSQSYNLNKSDYAGEDDEAVRCICGLDDYPGPPKLEEESKSRAQESVQDPLIFVTDAAEHLAGFFLQCDICKVWQHGGCVGIKNEGSSPEEYFCERCRKDLHKIFTASNGQRYSHYLPLNQSMARLGSRSNLLSKEEIRSPRVIKSGRSSSLQSANAKRRSTMNSRDAAYDEEEQISKAIEASKDVKNVENNCLNSRRCKRSRSVSGDKPNTSKRQRTKSTSLSPSPSYESNLALQRCESSESAHGGLTASKRTRSLGPKNVTEIDHIDEKENFRSDALEKRSLKSDQRRVNDPGTAKEIQGSIKNPSSKNNNNNSNITGFSPNSTPQDTLEPSIASQSTVIENLYPNQNSASVKKGGRPSNSRRGKSGKNQYTKDRDLQDRDDHSVQRSQSHDTSKTDDNVYLSCNKVFTSDPKVGRYKGNLSKITLTDMKKRVAAILDFISRTQLEMADELISRTSGDSSWDLVSRMPESLPDSITSNEKNSQNGSTDIDGDATCPTKEFQDLSCRDMMDVLTKKLIMWQKEFLA